MTCDESFKHADLLALLYCSCFLQGEDIVKNIEAQGSSSGTPKAKVTIVDSGEL